MSEQRNLILAIVLSVGIILGFQYFYEFPKMREAQKRPEGEAVTEVQKPAPTTPPGTAGVPSVAGPAVENMLIEKLLQQTPRLPIDNGRLFGSMALESGRLDDILLSDYRESIEPDSPNIRLLRPAGLPDSYFAEFGWVAPDEDVPLPDRSTRWQTKADRLGRDNAVELVWDNGAGLTFKRRISVDSDYMFTITREVVNNGTAPITLYPYALVSRWGTPKTLGYYILHEGPIGVLDGTLNEINYKDLVEEGKVALESKGGWLGFTVKYWLVALVPDQARQISASFRYIAPDGKPRYQADFAGKPVTVAPGASVSVTDRLFVGAKEVNLLDRYRDELGIPLFDRAVDFGWFYFLTKPMFKVLHFLYTLTGNYGIAILILTLLIRAILFPLANKSYRAMSKMKQLQPQMMKIRERFGDDKARMNQELMALYKREKVNPMSGCLPIVVQIPIFFSLYKVLFVSIEMRHAPFFGWIRDLSAPDPTTVFNLFGLVPWDPPSFLHIGALPLLMGITMWLQQKLNPQPADPTQAKVMMLLPVMFTFLFARFPAGLVLYWTWTNILSIAQQWLIMRQMGAAATPAKS